MYVDISALFFKNPESNIGYSFIYCVSWLSNTNVKENQSLKSRSHLHLLLPCSLEKVIHTFWPWSHSQIWPRHNGFGFFPKFNTLITFAKPVSPFLCAHISRYLQAGSSTPTCLNLASLLASIPSPTSSAKSSLLSQFTLIDSFWILRAQNIKSVFKMSSRLILPPSHKSVVYLSTANSNACRGPEIHTKAWGVWGIRHWGKSI